MKISVVIVNYQTAELTMACLHSLLLEQNKIEFNVIVVENDSKDNSYEILSSAVEEKGWSHWVKIIKAKWNGGFAYGNNIAIREFLAGEDSSEYIYLLNPDTCIREGAISELYTFLETHPTVGIVGGRLEDTDGTAQNSSFKFHTWKTELDRGFSLGILSSLLKTRCEDKVPEQATQTDWVAGASMLIRSTLFEQIGLMDESYFMYYEEMDFCFQATLFGWECWYVPSSHVVHYRGKSSGITDNKVKAKRRPKYWFNSRRRFFLKNYGVTHALFSDIAWLFGFSTWLLRNKFQKKQHNHPPRFLYDSFINSIFVRGFHILPVKNK